ncbi:hypothetical protein [Marinobacter zhejiangensis]|uniref:Uncharacterized protein n=1 Tax=Marinobacter zhejiangensis TaxID=488535 RepID=A0A1I4NDV7_9GAMM|nr:hypothetical protein [Marinobacter zhejiangensis]SFM13393.1 hypothetical protein SAMN04487963_1306 [Marinobacter zhejiangensis]
MRYVIPDRIEEVSNGKIKSDGYDYLDDGVNSMVIFMLSESPKEGIQTVLDVLSEEKFCDNWVLGNSVIDLNEKGQYTVVYPKSFKGGFEVKG